MNRFSLWHSAALINSLPMSQRWPKTARTETVLQIYVPTQTHIVPEPEIGNNVFETFQTQQITFVH